MGLIKPRANVIDHYVTTGTYITRPQRANTELLIPVKVNVSEISMIMGFLMGATGGNDDITCFIAVAKAGTTGQWISALHRADTSYWTQEHVIYNNSNGQLVVGFNEGLFFSGGYGYQVVIVKK